MNKLPHINPVLYRSRQAIREYAEFNARAKNSKRREMDKNIETGKASEVAQKLERGMIVSFSAAMCETTYPLRLYIQLPSWSGGSDAWVIPMSPTSYPACSREVRLITEKFDEANPDDERATEFLSMISGSAFQSCCVLQCWNAFCLPREKIVGVANILRIVQKNEIAIADYVVRHSWTGVDIPGDYLDRVGARSCDLPEQDRDALKMYMKEQGWKKLFDSFFF